jgi:type II secretion system protein I
MSARLRQILGRRRSACSGAERGFTLIEALVSLFIVSLAIVAMVQASARTLRTQASAERHLEAVALAEWRLDAIAVLPDDSLEWYADVRSGQISLGLRRYVWHAIVRQQQDTRLWRAEVSIEWEEGDFDLETVFFRRGDDRLRRLQGP